MTLRHRAHRAERRRPLVPFPLFAASTETSSKVCTSGRVSWDDARSRQRAATSSSSALMTRGLMGPDDGMVLGSSPPALLGPRVSCIFARLPWPQLTLQRELRVPTQQVQDAHALSIISHVTFSGVSDDGYSFMPQSKRKGFRREHSRG